MRESVFVRACFRARAMRASARLRVAIIPSPPFLPTLSLAFCPFFLPFLPFAPVTAPPVDSTPSA